MGVVRIVILMVLQSVFLLTVFGQEEADSNAIVGQKKFTYTDEGWQFTSHDGNYLMHLEWRGQFRFAYPTDSDPLTNEDYADKELNLTIRRARMKVGGHAYRPFLKYYLEYELFASNLLDFRLMFDRFQFFKFKVGQWKVHYNRERIISSGKQETVERSILTRPFTIDRQQGISFYGRLNGPSVLDFNYWISILAGTGRGNQRNDDGNLMYMTRLQWNFLGESLDFTGSDLSYHEKLGAIIAIAGVTNQSPYTRFSQSGGGQITGFEEGVAGQYRVNQFLLETAAKYRGISWQQEFHWKQIKDNVNFTDTYLNGNLMQIGYFPHYALDFVPQKLEAYFRYAWYDPDLHIDEDWQSEYTIGFNWFFHNHRNKLTAEVSFLSLNADDEQVSDSDRIRLQWDVSF